MLRIFLSVYVQWNTCVRKRFMTTVCCHKTVFLFNSDHAQLNIY